MGSSFGRELTWVYLWLILVDVLQKTTKFCKEIILQLKKKKKWQKKKIRYTWCPKVVTIKSSWKPQEGLPMGCLN